MGGKHFKRSWAFAIILSLSNSYCLADENPTFDLDQVVVTATRNEEKIKDVAASVSVITSADIEKSGATNIAEVLKKVSGLFVVDLYGNGNDVRIGLRGFQGVNANQNIQLQIDGIPANDQSQGFSVALSNINLDNIDRIEVVRGPGSALYGSNSMGGVINIITKKGGLDSKTTLTVNSGSFNSRDYAFSRSGQENNLSYALTYRQQEGDGYRRNSDYDNKLFHSRFDIDLGKSQTIELLFDHSDRYFGLPGTLTQDEYDRNPRIASTPDDYRKVKEDRIAIVHNAEIGPDVSLNNKIFYSKVKQNIRMDYDIPPRNEYVYHLNDSDGKTLGIESQLNFKQQIGRTEHAFIAGILYKKEELARDYFYEVMGVARPTSNNTLERRTTAFFVQDHFDLSRQASVTLGLRRDNFDYDYSDHKNTHNNYSSSTDALSPKLAVNYKISDKTSAYASIAKAFKPPSNPKLLFTDKLEPEKAWNYEIGLKSSPNEKVNYSLAVYRMNIENLIVLNPVDLFSSLNAGKGHHQGVEFEIEHMLDANWSAVLNYSYTQAKYDKYSYEDDYGAFHIADGKKIEEVPKQMVVAGLRYDDRRKFQGNLSLRWLDKQYMDPMNTAQLPSYAVVDLGLKNKLDSHMTLSLSILNLFDKKYAENAHFNSDIREYGYLPANGRSVWLGLTHQF
ncbi:exported hypothetical protein [uncultured Sporomusa sp.]|uniref:TonB-dependent receptor n=1 Tax=uncultured Sporomusa sp. TaxID=307249 RepID=A0A212M0H9_9FIRM|nr:TonB-dependent receptor [uncultured Sporomusa sp.]SCM83240.1 exported hypothetical protein [uncultured Sporomusa sp.]